MYSGSTVLKIFIQPTHNQPIMMKALLWSLICLGGGSKGLRVRRFSLLVGTVPRAVGGSTSSSSRDSVALPPRAGAGAPAPPVAPPPPPLPLTDDRDAFLFGQQRTTFAACGVHDDVTAALSRCGKVFASTIQLKAFSAILSGEDVVVGSETGSGKTLSYLVPIIHRLVEMRGETGTTAADADADADADANASRGPHQRRYPFAVVMCPSKELAAQVYRMANDLIAELNTRGTSAAPVAAGLFTQQLEQWPYFTDADPSPDIAICTPAFLAKFIKGPNIQDPDLFRSVRVLVMDEVRGAHRYLTARVCFLTAARLHTYFIILLYPGRHASRRVVPEGCGEDQRSVPIDPSRHDSRRSDQCTE